MTFYWPESFYMIIAFILWIIISRKIGLLNNDNSDDVKDEDSSVAEFPTGKFIFYLISLLSLLLLIIFIVFSLFGYY